MCRLRLPCTRTNGPRNGNVSPTRDRKPVRQTAERRRRGSSFADGSVRVQLTRGGGGGINLLNNFRGGKSVLRLISASIDSKRDQLAELKDQRDIIARQIYTLNQEVDQLLNEIKDYC